MSSEHETDLGLKTKLSRLLIFPAASRTWSDVEEGARERGWTPVERRPLTVGVVEQVADQGHVVAPKASTPRRRSGLRIAVFASIAIVLVAAVTVGTLEALKYLGSGQPMLVITDETTVTTSGVAVVAIGANSSGQCDDASSWTDIVQVATAGSHIVGLKSDGTVLAVGDNGDAQLDVGSWTDIVQIAASGGQTVGLKSDGTVVAAGPIWFELGGPAVALGDLISSWTNIVQVATAGSHVVGLKADGTVVAVPLYGEGLSGFDGTCDVGSWTDIVQVAAGHANTIGLESDGTVVAVGTNRYGELDVGSWTDIVQVASDGYSCTVGLKSDGRVVAVGAISVEGNPVALGGELGALIDPSLIADGSFLGIQSWTDIVQVAAGEDHIVGLKADGTVVAVGTNNYGQCDVDSWTDIVQVAAGEESTVGLQGTK